jgi:hypothetical protein
MTHAARLADELTEARVALIAALDALPASEVARDDLVGAWGARELLAHLGYWAGHSAEAIHRVVLGEAGAFDLEGPDVEHRNATVARVARQTPMATVRAREEAAALALVERLRALDDGLLVVVLPDGSTLEQQVRLDGPDHYREHTEQLARR